jgi:hypothetical protein
VEEALYMADVFNVGGLLKEHMRESEVALVILLEGNFFCTDGGLYHIVNSIHFLLEILLASLATWM